MKTFGFLTCLFVAYLELVWTNHIWFQWQIPIWQLILWSFIMMGLRIIVDYINPKLGDSYTTLIICICISDILGQVSNWFFHTSLPLYNY